MSEKQFTCCQIGPQTPAPTIEDLTRVAHAALAQMGFLRDWEGIKTAIDIAFRVHIRQRDKGGEPYLWHPLRVGFSLLPNIEACILGILHDVIEDVDPPARDELTEEIEASFGKETLSILLLLTRGCWTSYDEYIKCIRRSARATKVKIADLQDNLKPERNELAAKLSGREFVESHRKKYERALELLLTLDPPEPLRCGDCIHVRGRSVCTMNCGPCIPSKEKPHEL
jgi:hypothetical protein